MVRDTSARSTVLVLVRDAARLDRTQSDPVIAARNAIGVAAPLAVGVLAGNIAVGLAATIGALQTSFADRPGPYRLRALRMVGTALAAAVTSGLAVMASRSDAASVALLAVFAFIAGLLIAGGPSAAQVGVAGTGAALVLGHLMQPADVAVHVGLLVLAGGVGQAVLAVAAWPLGRHKPERTALAGLYRALATASRDVPQTGYGPPAGDTFVQVRQTLYGLGHDHGRSVEAYRVLLDEAERIRRELLVLAALGERLVSEREPILSGRVRGALAAAAGVLDDIGDALLAGRAVPEHVLQQARTEIDAAIDRLGSAPGATARAAAGRLQRLAGQLRAAVDSTRTGASEGGHDDGARRPLLGVLREPVSILRANLSLRSPVMRHALRMAALVAGSDLVVRLAGFGRGYWVALTVLVVLRPDFGATVQRAVMRVLGTVVGLLLATELARVLPIGGWWPVLVIAALIFAMRLAGPGNVALSAVALSALVVVLLELDGVAAHTTVVDRAVATAVGGALAVLALLATPTWERRFVAVRLAELLDAYRQYLRAVADPATDRKALVERRTASRIARANAQASVERAAAEPVHARRAVELGRATLTHSHRFVNAALTVEALRPAVAEGGGVAELRVFLDAAAEALDAAAARLRAFPAELSGKMAQSAEAESNRPRVRSLRPLQDELATFLREHPERVGDEVNATTLIDATDRIADSLNTLTDELRRQQESIMMPT